MKKMLIMVLKNFSIVFDWMHHLSHFGKVKPFLVAVIRLIIFFTFDRDVYMHYYET